jgi:predicted ABC-type exoprotein transport system permease subunit
VSDSQNNLLAFFIQLLPLTIVMLILVVPTAKILRRIGYSRAWALLWLIPIVNIIALWVLASAKWPRDHEDTAKVFK